MKFDVVIIGAGASGLICAYKLAKDCPYLNIAVLEKEAIPGRKLRAAGNGKCNITNQVYNATCYHSQDMDIFNEFIDKHDYTDILTLLDEIGILYYEQNGYYYPLSNQGKQFVDVLVKRCMDRGITFNFETTVTSVKQDTSGYSITINHKNSGIDFYSCKYLVFATGGSVSPKLGGSSIGFDLVKTLGMKVHNQKPVLSPIYIDDKDLAIAKGVRVNGAVTLKHINGTMVKEYGQIQFNDKNISGIVVMNISCYFNQWYDKQQVEGFYLDLLPDYKWDNLKSYFKGYCGNFMQDTILDALNCLFPAPLSKYIIKRCHVRDTDIISDFSEKQIHRLTSAIKKLDLNAYYKADYDKAQVTGGGVCLKEMNMDTFECKSYKHLYLLGELLDVNGKCGGYNITFAMQSGMDAANAIKNETRNLYD